MEEGVLRGCGAKVPDSGLLCETYVPCMAAVSAEAMVTHCTATLPLVASLLDQYAPRSSPQALLNQVLAFSPQSEKLEPSWLRRALRELSRLP